MRRFVGTTPAMLGLAAMLAIGGLGCSGGDGDDGGPPPVGSLVITVTGVTQPSPGVVCATFTVTGANANALVNIVPEYVRLSAATVQIPASPITNALAMQLGLNDLLGTSGEVTVNGSGEFLNGVFYWWAGQDLGFIQDSVQICLTPTDPMNAGQAGTTGCSTFFVYDAGQQSSSSSGAGAGSGASGQPTGGTGRAGHTAHSVRGTNALSGEKNIAVAGGYNDSSNPNAFDSVDRFRFSGSTHMVPFGGLMSDRRVLHASAWYLAPTGGTRVLVCGGVDSASVEALNPGSPDIASRVTPGSESASADIYSFSPESVAPTGSMAFARFGHTATWVPECNAVIVIGGARFPSLPSAGSTIQGLTSIERFDPANGTWTTSMAALNAPRVEHTATLLKDGRVLVYGGYDPANPTQALEPEVYDPVADTVIDPISMALVPSISDSFGRTGHTATRLFDGRVLVAGGRDLNGNLLDTAQLMTPVNQDAGTPTFNFTNLTMGQARARHAATVLGTGLVLFTGGVSLDGTSSAEFTNAAEIFDPSLVQGPIPFTTPFSAVNFMQEARAEHTLTASECGSVFVIGGRNQTMGGSPDFLDSIEFYAFSNAIPALSDPMTASTTLPSMVGIEFTVTDAESDGGYVIVRYRQAGTTKWRNAFIDSQVNPTGGTQTPATGRVTSGNYRFIWNFNANGLSSGQLVDIQLIPVGANIGTAVQFQALIP